MHVSQMWLVHDGAEILQELRDVGRILLSSHYLSVGFSITRRKWDKPTPDCLPVA